MSNVGKYGKNFWKLFERFKINIDGKLFKGGFTNVNTYVNQLKWFY